jgi:hypothetical protein
MLPLCEGCGRQVHRLTSFYARRIFCCERCESRLGACVAKAKRASGRAGKTCTVCGESFDAGKSSAITCSNACRQKGYRRRRRGLGLLAGTGLSNLVNEIDRPV